MAAKMTTFDNNSACEARRDPILVSIPMFFITKEFNKVICLVTDTFLGKQPSLFQYGRQNMYILYL